MIDNVSIPFSSNWNNIAISLSGGADSALLSYMLCDLIRQNNANITVHIISHIRMWKTRPWQRYDNLRVFNYLKTSFPNIEFKRHENFIAPDLEWGNSGPILIDEYGSQTSGDITEIRSFAEYVCYHNDVDAYFNAVTRNPRNVDFKGMDKRDIEPTEDNQNLRITTHMNKLACHPFRFIEKSWVIKQYKNMEINDLFNITRSCEGEFENLDYTTYKEGMEIPICGKCFWCKEREWAVDQNK